MKPISLLSVTLAAATALACGSDPKEPAAAPSGDTETPSTTATTTPAEAPASEKPGDDPRQSQINIDEAIRKACGITEADAYFAYNSAAVKGQDYPTLNKLAKCFIDGPMKGRKMRLVGHADPRGDEEYNLVLGGRRADNVKGYLSRKGVPDGQLSSTSRGEMDASGTDEASWSKDRRVDIVLAD